MLNQLTISEPVAQLAAAEQALAQGITHAQRSLLVVPIALKDVIAPEPPLRAYARNG
jgi:hypothetical protein